MQSFVIKVGGRLDYMLPLHVTFHAPIPLLIDG